MGKYFKLQNKRWQDKLLLLAFGLMFSGSAFAGLSFSQVFTPETIGPGNISTLSYTIENTSPDTPDENIAFTNTLPSQVDIATPANVSSTCVGTLTAPDGGDTITFSDGSLGAAETCTISVNVTSSEIGEHTNVTGDLTSDAGNSGTSIEKDLTVVDSTPGFSKSFSPDSIAFGGRSTLTFTIDNGAAGETDIFDVQFTDNLPDGMIIAAPSNASTTCPNVNLTAVSGSQIISLTDAYISFSQTILGAGESCTVIVDVLAIAAGQQANVSSDLSFRTANPNGAFYTPSAASFSAGKAGDYLEVTIDTLSLIKSFTNDPVPAGGTVDLEFTIGNYSRTDTATGITFTDNLESTLTGLSATGLSISACGGTLSGTSVLTFAGGSIAAGETCTFITTLQIPANSATGNYTNTSSAIEGNIGGNPVTGNQAIDILFIQPAPLLTKQFIPNPVGSGESTTLQFTIKNTSTTSAATGITFSDPMHSGATITALPTGEFCGSASASVDTDTATPNNILSILINSLASSESCTFSIDILMPENATGEFINVTTPITATVDGALVTGFPATDTLNIVRAPKLTKEFTDDPVDPGDTVTLEFTLNHELFATGDATGITFTDDLSAALAGLTATGLPISACGGTLSGTAGSTLLNFSGGTLTPGESCTFNVSLDVPDSTVIETYTNTTSLVSAEVSGVTATSAAASDDLIIAGLSIVKSFSDELVIPGDTVTLEFTISNNSPASNAASIKFTDSLNTMLSGLAVTGSLPTTPCGPLSALAGTNNLIFSDGELLSGESCTFNVTLLVPSNAISSTYTNTTSILEAKIDDSIDYTEFDATTAKLTVLSEVLSLTKTFAGETASPGSAVNIEFTLTNIHKDSADTITFTDDLDAALSGLITTGVLIDQPCGSSSSLTGGDTISLSNGELAGESSCTFIVSVQIPDPAAIATFTNTTSDVSGIINSLPVSGLPATDNLRVVSVDFSKAFSAKVGATGSVTLNFNMSNLDTINALNSLSFTDDLNAVIPGLVATNLPLTDICGSGSTLSGTSSLSFSGGVLNPGSNCNFDVVLQVPSTATPGVFSNITSNLFSSGLLVSNPASALLTIEPAPLFNKFFLPNNIIAGATSTLSFTINNTASDITASNLSFTDNLPAGLSIASPGNASTTCTGGTITAVSGSNTFSYTGGSVSAAGSCIVKVKVTAVLNGSYNNLSGHLTSTSGDSGTSANTLNVNSVLLGFSKQFTPSSVNAGAVSILNFTIDNSGALVNASALNFTDNLPSGMTIADANASTDCIGGTLTATTGESIITYSGGTVAAAATCTVFVNVTANSAGSYHNISGDLTSSSGTTGSSSSILTVNSVLPGFSKQFTPDNMNVGAISTLNFTIDNSGSLVETSSISFSDNLPSGMTIADSNASTDCTGGTLTATIGESIITYSGGSVAASESCSVQVNVTANTPASYNNTSSKLTSSSGDSDAASATLIVNSLTSVTGPTATGSGDATVSIIGAAANCNFLEYGWVPVSSVTDVNLPGLSFPHGLFQFRAGPGCTGTITLQYTLPSTLADDTQFWKFGPTIDKATPHWYSLPVTFSGNISTVKISDGGDGDHALNIIGEIVDPGGPTTAAAAEPIPALDLPKLMMLILFMALIGFILIRRQHQIVN